MSSKNIFFLFPMLSLCLIFSSVTAQTKNGVKAKNTSVKGIFPIIARYQCYRLMSTGMNQVSEDIYILSGGTYKTMNKTGKYTYNPQSRILSFTSGPLNLPKDKWVGVYTGKGEPTSSGGKTVDAILEIRRKWDVDEGNLKVLQQCTCTK